MSRRFFIVTIILVSMVLLPSVGLAYTSSICKSDTGCVETEVGPFMHGISQECGNTGTCSLNDIMKVVTNVGNYVVGLVGVVVLLMYTIGGAYYLTAGMKPENAKKGKDYLKISTIGLFIVFFAYMGINTLKAVLTGGDVSAPGDSSLCVGAQDNTQCAENSRCVSGTCTPNCVADSANLNVKRTCEAYSIGDQKADARGCTNGGCPGDLLCCNPIPKNAPGMQEISE